MMRRVKAIGAFFDKESRERFVKKKKDQFDGYRRERESNERFAKE